MAPNADGNVPNDNFAAEQGIKVTEGGEEGVKVRRVGHLLWGLFGLYYWVPYYILGVPRELYLVIIVALIPLSFEVYRVNRGIIYKGMRVHEKYKVASYVWFALAIVFVLLVFPPIIAAPVVMTTGFVDPTISLLRKYRRRYVIGISMLLGWAIFMIFQYHPVMALFGAFLAIISESIDIRLGTRIRPSILYSRSTGKVSEYYEMFKTRTRFDDDFIMTVIPAVVLTIIWLNVPEAFPGNWMEPLWPSVPVNW